MTDTYSDRLRLIKRLGVGVCILLLAAVVFWPGVTTIQSADDAEVIEEIAGMGNGQDPDVHQAVLQSVDVKNRPYNIYADAVTDYSDQGPEADKNRNIRLAAPRGTMVLSDESVINLVAVGGTVRGEKLVLKGQVSFLHDKSGYAFKTEEATIDMDAKTAEGDKAIQGHNRSSRINAQGFRIGDGGRSILFTGNSVLFIYPDAVESDGEPAADGEVFAEPPLKEPPLKPANVSSEANNSK